MPARVFVEYLNKGKNRKRFNDLYATALYSDDHGKTWNSSAPFPISGIGESGLVELKDGTIYHNSRTHMRSGNRRIAYSKDAGETWFGEHEDDELFDGPPDEYGCKAALARLRYHDRDILLFCSPGLKDKRHDFTVWVSFDGGKSWPHQKLIKAGSGNYPWMAVGRKGTPSENLIYVLAGKDWCARFNLEWLFSDGKYPPAVVK
jgi:sialidase-1